ncbi:DUF1028 domain-containing protein [Nonomuraea spiralis]|uniref:DUF1028 domain-containing protein n=1 Tax=Nonomuraea spiralis TaxID=46182 RepID=A0ABV5IU43_9ACTN|nr:DUF1028 domain-containing protein [Nonomuraea spiralis]GGT30528.1 hypothetical protein GCM10010176_088880 [Nonomuraea spiralis]
MTFSVVARDERTGRLGIAVASHFLGVGRLAPWARPGVGAVATQAFVDPAYGPRGLDLLAEGYSAQSALDRLLAADPDQGQRQVALVDAAGAVAVHTGRHCYAEAEHRIGPGVVAQGNMLGAPGIPHSMVQAFLDARGDFAARLLAALRTGERAGGDARGRQSASLYIVAAHRADPAVAGVEVDLRVDDHDDPLAELGRLLDLHRAYADIGVIFAPGVVSGDRVPEDGDVAAALAALSRAAGLLPGHAEPLMWSAIVLARAGRLAEAAEARASALVVNPDLGGFFDRLREQGVVTTA